MTVQALAKVSGDKPMRLDVANAVVVIDNVTIAELASLTIDAPNISVKLTTTKKTSDNQYLAFQV